MKEFFEQHIVLCLLLLLLPLIITAYVLNYVASSTAEIITLLAGIFTYYGTVILALVTVMQNDRLMGLEERSAQIAETKLKEENRPRFIIDSIKTSSEKEDYMLDCHSIIMADYETAVQGNLPADVNSFYFVLKNDSEVPAVNVMVYDFGVQQLEKAKDDCFGYFDRCFKEVSGGKSIFLWYTIKEAKCQTFRFNMTYDNIYGQHFYNKIFVMASDYKGAKQFQCAIGEQSDGEAKLGLQTELF